MRTSYLLSGLGLLCVLGCPTSTTVVDCGDGGSYSEDDVGRYCSYIVVRGGFTCPPALANAVPVGTGMVCTDLREPTPERLPPTACEGLDDPRCGTASRACAGPTRETEYLSCSPGFPDPAFPPGEWTRDLLDVDTELALEDGDRLVVGTQPDGSLGASVAMRTEGAGFVCSFIEIAAIGSDGSEVQTIIGSALTSRSDAGPGGSRYVFTFGVPGLGPTVVRVSFLGISGALQVWERELELICE